MVATSGEPTSSGDRRGGIARHLPRLLWHYGEPFADNSVIPTYYVSKLARRHVPMVLTGDAVTSSLPVMTTTHALERACPPGAEGFGLLKKITSGC